VCELSVAKPEARDYLRDIGINVRIIVKWTSKKNVI
jgi:hypothetical protein